MIILGDYCCICGLVVDQNNLCSAWLYLLEVLNCSPQTCIPSFREMRLRWAGSGCSHRMPCPGISPGLISSVWHCCFSLLSPLYCIYHQEKVLLPLDLESNPTQQRTFPTPEFHSRSSIQWLNTLTFSCLVSSFLNNQDAEKGLSYSYGGRDFFGSWLKVYIS